MSKIYKRGFTLIELLVVIAIIGILSSVVLASLNTARAKANDAKRFTNLQAVRNALELYATSNNGQYPNSGGNWNSQCSAWTQTTAANSVPGLVSGGFIPQLPTDPDQSVSGNTCCHLYYSGGGTTDYKYMLYNCPTSKECTTVGGGFEDPVRNTSSCAIYTPGGAGW
ncbi:MAG: type II secretion system protein [Candidatus Pacebacteria bacterium]|jgi:type II secretion system protein G|nr:type II secretion system protein [Candidatus Paceibacterota bacterium]